jgi:Tfp pilus assembly protein PilV
MTRQARHRAARGASLIEALVAMAIMGFGMLAVLGVQGTLRYNADIARQRAEATRLAEQELESVRTFSTVVEFDAIANKAATPLTDPMLNTTFTLARNVSVADDGRSLSIAVQISWPDRNGDTQQIHMHDMIARVDPLLSGFVRAPKPFSLIGRRDGRHPTIPTDAKPLGDISIFKPPGGTGTVGWVFNNATGAITHTCTGLTVVQSALELSHVTSNCTLLTTPAQLVSGEVRFNLRGATNVIAADESVIKPARTGSVAWVIGHSTQSIERICSVPASSGTDALTAGDLSGCASAAIPVIPFAPTDDAHTLAAGDSESPGWPRLPAAVDLDHTVTFSGFGAASNFQCYADAPTLASVPSAKSIPYFCIVLVDNPSGWSGRTRVEPQPYSDNGSVKWEIGTTAGTYRVCRYTQADTDDTDAADHPATYPKWVVGNLINQNFLVIDALKTCPTDSAPSAASGDLVNSNTRLHQSTPIP